MDSALPWLFPPPSPSQNPSINNKHPTNNRRPTRTTCPRWSGSLSAWHSSASSAACSSTRSMPSTCDPYNAMWCYGLGTHVPQSSTKSLTNHIRHIQGRARFEPRTLAPAPGEGRQAAAGPGGGGRGWGGPAGAGGQRVVAGVCLKRAREGGCCCDRLFVWVWFWVSGEKVCIRLLRGCKLMKVM